MSVGRIAIVGTGAIGGYYGAKLAVAGGDVRFLVRDDLREFRERGLRIIGKDEDIHLPRINAFNTSSEIGPSDLVIIAVKTTANPKIVDAIAPLLHETTMLLTLQNGLGNEEFFAHEFGAERILGGLCFICLTRTARTVIGHYDRGSISIGEYQQSSTRRAETITQQFTSADIPCRVVADLALERWRKLVWNIPFNGLCITEGGVDTSVIMADPRLRERAELLMREVIHAANACGHFIAESEADEQMRRTRTMGAYKPSTLIDWEAGRPLEIEAIWGEPLRRARAADAETPFLAELYGELNRLTERKIDSLHA